MTCWRHRTKADVLAAWMALCMIPATAHAFCGFYVAGADAKLFNDATQVVLMREGTTTVLSMRNHYDGPPEDFAMVVPVPTVLHKDNVHVIEHALFDKIDTLTAPRLVEYWQRDPCSVSHYAYGMGARLGSAGRVRIEAQFAVGEYDVVVLSASDSSALDRWLRANSYNIPEGAEAVLRPYIASGMKFFVAKVNIARVKRVDGRVVLSPLRFHYTSETFSLPVRLGMLNARGTQDLIIHILARGQRYEVANRPNVTIPTNIHIKPDAKDHFGAFYASLFDDTLNKHPNAVVTEYAWDASSCDPCPGPSLTLQDFVNLGADVLPGQPTSDVVITRLHARLNPKTLTDDLIFKAAPPIAGGREMYRDVEDGPDTQLYGGEVPSRIEQGAQPSSVNNFQGRYIIRHRWHKKLACEQPISVQWDSFPPEDGIENKTRTAKNIAFTQAQPKRWTRWIDSFKDLERSRAKD